MSQLQGLMNQLIYGQCTLVDFKKSAMQLARQGTDLSVTDTSKNIKGTLLHHLVRTNINGCNNHEIAELTNLTLIKDFINIPDGFGCTPLQALNNQLVYGKCSLEDYKKTAMYLVQLGANPLKQDTTSIKGTVLHHLIRTNKNNINQKEITQLITLRKKLIDIPDGFDSTPLQALINQLILKKCTPGDFKKSAMLLAKLGADTSKEFQGTLLHHLIRTNRNGDNFTAITELLTLNKNLVNIPDGTNCTPLQALMNQLIAEKCSLSDFKQSATLLANLGANLAVTDTSDNMHGTLLHHLVRTNHNGINNHEIANLLLYKTNLINVQDGFGCTPLQALMNQLLDDQCTLDNFKISAVLLANLDANLEVRDTSPKIKGTLLHHLLRTNSKGENNQAISGLLIIKSSLIHARDGFGCTPLQTLLNQFINKKCTLGEFKKYAMMLAKFGANLEVQDTGETKGTLLHHLILTNKSGINDKDIVELLTLRPDLVNIEDGYGNRLLVALMNQALDKACSLADFKKSSMLLANRGADLCVTDTSSSKGTILHLLVNTNENGVNNKDISALLTLRKDLINSKDGFGRIPLHNLLGCKSNVGVDVVKRLLDAGSDLCARDIYGETMLHACCISGNLEIAKYLVSKELDINAKTKSGKTMLHYAVKNDNKALWKWLCGYDIPVNQPDESLQTALHLAAINGNHTMVHWLIQNKANITLEDSNGNTALALAEQCGHQTIVSILKNAEPIIHNFKPVSASNPKDPVREKALQQVRHHVAILLYKEQELKDNYSDTAASIAAKLLCLRMTQYADAFVTSQISLETFKTMSTWAIDKAHEELDKPRGFCVKQILVNLALAISTLMVGYLIAVACKGTFFPLVPNTDSANKINELATSACSIPAC